MNGSPYLVTSNGPVVFAPTPVGVDVSGWLAGGQIGANYQAGSWVVGAEADVSGANLTGSTTCISTPIAAGVVLAGLPLPANCSVKVVGLGTIAGRLGFALDRTLVYGKGGAAWANYKYDLTPDNEVADLLPTFSGNETKWGWMLGAGRRIRLLRQLVREDRIQLPGFQHQQSPVHGDRCRPVRPQHRHPAAAAPRESWHQLSMGLGSGRDPVLTEPSRHRVNERRRRRAAFAFSTRTRSLYLRRD